MKRLPRAIRRQHFPRLSAEAQMVIVFEFTTDESEVKIGSRGNRPFRITVTGSGGHAAYPEQLG